MVKKRKPRKKASSGGKLRWILLVLILAGGAFFPWPITRFIDSVTLPMGSECEPLQITLGSASFAPALGLRVQGLSAQNKILNLQSESVRIGVSLFRGFHFAPGPGTVTLEKVTLKTSGDDPLSEGFSWQCLEPNGPFPPPKKIQLRKFLWTSKQQQPSLSAEYLNLSAHTDANGALDLSLDGKDLTWGTRKLPGFIVHARNEGPDWELKKIRADILEGRIEGEGAFNPLSGEARLELRAHSLDLAALPPPRTAPGAALQGRCQGRLRLKHSGEKWLPNNLVKLNSFPGWEGQSEGGCRDVILDHLPFQASYLVKNFLPDLQTLKLERLDIDSARLHASGIQLQGLRAQGPQLSLEAKGDMTFSQDIRLWLTLHFNPDFMDQVEGVVREAVTMDSLDRPSLSLALEGNWERQTLILPQKTVGKVVSSQFKKIGRGFGKLFGGGSKKNEVEE
jgi:hypothetical protein